MSGRVAFVGGCSGSGKSTFCRNVSPEWIHRVASELIARELQLPAVPGASTKPLAGNATEADKFQHLLLRALNNDTAPLILLDGHYIVPTVAGPARVPLWFFARLNPTSLYLVETPSDVLLRRLREREKTQGTELVASNITDEARLERDWAEVVAGHLGRPLHKIDGTAPPATWLPANEQLESN